MSSPWTSRGQACSKLSEREAEDKVYVFVTKVAELGNPHDSSHSSPRKSEVAVVAGPGTAFVLLGLTLSRSRWEPAPPSTSTANTRCRIPITGIACSAQIPASVRTLYRTQFRIHLVYPPVFMIIRRCHRYTHSRLQFGLHRVKVLVPVPIQISHHIYHSVPSHFPFIHGHTFASSCTTPIFQHEWLSLSFT